MNLRNESDWATLLASQVEEQRTFPKSRDDDGVEFMLAGQFFSAAIRKKGSCVCNFSVVLSPAKQSWSFQISLSTRRAEKKDGVEFMQHLAFLLWYMNPRGTVMKYLRPAARQCCLS